MTDVVVSPLAVRDLFEILDHYLLDAGVPVAMNFQTAWDRVMHHLAAFPASGSLRLAEDVGIRGLRVWPVRGHALLALYIEEGDGVTILRVVHTSRDIPNALQE